MQALLAQLLLAELRSADLYAQPDGAAIKLKDMVSNEDRICGGPEIWREVTLDQTPTGVQNIKWKKIDAIAEAYIKAQELKVKTLKATLTNLAEHIAQVKAREHIKDASYGQIRALVTAGAKPFETLENARRTNCGSPSIRPRAPRGAFRKAQQDFEPEAEQVFQGSVKLGQAPFLEICQDLLTCENGQASCWCTQLCQKFRDISQQVSDKNVGEHVGGSDELVRSENAAQEKLAARQKELTDCQKAKEQLDAFGKQIKLLKEQAHERHDKLQDAEEALYDAQEELADLEADLEQEQEAERKAMEVLQAATGDFEQATAALQKLGDDEKALVAQVEQTVATLGTSRQALDDATAADKAMNQLRELVSVTMMKMEMFFDQAVQAPVRSLGITMDLDLNTVFVGAPAEMSSAGAMREAVDAMSKYCSQDGRAAIDSMKEKLDLTQLCQLETADNIKTDINKAVSDGLKIVRGRIEQVRSWLNPYRGQSNMNDTAAEALVKQGEPAGLRRILEAYGSTGFYKQYLKNWKLGGSFLKILESLTSAVYSLQQAVEAMSTSLAELKARLAETTASREAAEKELEKASESQQLAQGKQAELKSHVEALAQQGQSMQRNIADLERQVLEAQRSYQEAVEKIKAAHVEGTSFLESWNQLQSEAADEARAEAAKAHDSLVSSRIETDKARQRYWLAMARFSELEELEEMRLPASARHAVVSDHRLHRQH